MKDVNAILLFFWWSLTMAAVLWYSTITVYVAFKGIFDIRGMLNRLAANHESPDAPAGRRE